MSVFLISTFQEPGIGNRIRAPASPSDKRNSAGGWVEGWVSHSHIRVGQYREQQVSSDFLLPRPGAGAGLPRKHFQLLPCCSWGQGLLHPGPGQLSAFSPDSILVAGTRTLPPYPPRGPGMQPSAWLWETLSGSLQSGQVLRARILASESHVHLSCLCPLLAGQPPEGNEELQRGFQVFSMGSAGACGEAGGFKGRGSSP